MGCGPSADTSHKAAVNDVPQQVFHHEYVFKLLLMGDLGVGKSSLLHQFTDGTFTEEHVRTNCIDFKMRTVKLDGERVKLQLWDTGGDEESHTIMPSYSRCAHGIMVLYDVTNQNSFNNVKHWLAEIERYFGDSVAKVLVGNRCDLTAHKAVDSTIAQEYADDIGIPFVETSAKDEINVDQAFITLAAEVKKLKENKTTG